eukprot:scaffold17319_cov99-Phaeocystis_antarctica.AAC.2
MCALRRQSMISEPPLLVSSSEKQVRPGRLQFGAGDVESVKHVHFSTGGFILVSDYVRMEVTLIGASWDVVAGDQTGCGLHSYEALWSTELPCARGRGPVYARNIFLCFDLAWHGRMRRTLHLKADEPNRTKQAR